MAEESLRLISTALERLQVTQSAQARSRHLKTPDVFKPESRDLELKGWSDWKFSFCNYVRGIDPALAAAMEAVEKELNGDYALDDMSEEMQGMAVRLYSLLTSYMRQRPLKLVRHVKQENGFIAWQTLLKEMQPATRARSLALLTQLSRVQFAEGKTLSEQLPQYEAIVAEYERISGREYSEDAKVASILATCNLQLWVDDSTTYESLKNKIHHLEALTTRWEASNSLALPTRASGDDPMLMEVDFVGKEKGKKGGKKGKDVKGKKGKSKSKDKGKGKTEGKGNWKGQEKGKTTWEKGPWRKPEKGKNEKGGKGSKSGVCHICGKPGHYAKDCWRRVQQVEEHSNPGGAASSSTGHTGGGTTPQTTTVKMVRIATPPDTPFTEVFDLTTPRTAADNEWHPWRVQMVRLADDFEESEQLVEHEVEKMQQEVFYDCLEPSVWAPEEVPIIALDLQQVETEDIAFHMIQMVSVGDLDEEACFVTLDSGADVSVLPANYGNVGEWRPGAKELKMVDAQGTRIAHQGLTRAKVRVKDVNGKEIEIIEEFVLGNVQHPIICAGRLLRRGWSIQSKEDSLQLCHTERDIIIPISNERHSLQFEARIYGIEQKNGKEVEEKRVMVLRGYLSRYVEELEFVPGWRRLPNGVIAHSDPVAVYMVDPSQSIEGDWKARMTLMKDKDGLWRQVENTENYKEQGEKAFRKVSTDRNPERMLTFFSPYKLLDYWAPNSEVPVHPYPEPTGEIRHIEWSDEEEQEREEELEEQVEAQDIEKRYVLERGDEVELDEVLYNEKSTVKELQLACRERGLPCTGSKKRLLSRLIGFKVDIEDKFQLNIASKLFREQQRTPMTLGQPKLPSLAEQELHFVTHWPYAAWCQACMASRAKEDKRMPQEGKPDLGTAIIQLDFMYTYTGPEGRMEEPTQGRVQERQDQFGACLIMASTETKAIHVVPVPSKGTASLKQVTEENPLFAGKCRKRQMHLPSGF